MGTLMSHWSTHAHTRGEREREREREGEGGRRGEEALTQEIKGTHTRKLGQTVLCAAAVPHENAHVHALEPPHPPVGALAALEPHVARFTPMSLWCLSATSKQSQAAAVRRPQKLKELVA